MGEMIHEIARYNIAQEALLKHIEGGPDLPELPEQTRIRLQGRLVEISEQPEESYTVDGMLYNWPQYFLMLTSVGQLDVACLKDICRRLRPAI